MLLRELAEHQSVCSLPGRYLSVRNLFQRIQSFPENFELVGSEAAQYRALGNAIPPVMFWYVAKTVRENLECADR